MAIAIAARIANVDPTVTVAAAPATSSKSLAVLNEKNPRLWRGFFTALQ